VTSLTLSLIHPTPITFSILKIFSFFDMLPMFSLNRPGSCLSMPVVFPSASHFQLVDPELGLVGGLVQSERRAVADVQRGQREVVAHLNYESDDEALENSNKNMVSNILFAHFLIYPEPIYLCSCLKTTSSGSDCFFIEMQKSWIFVET
jgi:hypothetical protein